MNASAIHDLRTQGRHEEALRLAVDLAAQQPADAEVQFEAACLHDYLGREAEAVPYYEAALGGTLTPRKRLQALVGLGSTLRVLGRFADARQTLQRAVEEFPEAAEARVFLAMAHHNCGNSKAAVEMLLALLAGSSVAPGVVAYRRAIELYAQDIDRTWP